MLSLTPPQQGVAPAERVEDAVRHMALKAVEARLIAEEARLESLCIISSSVFAGHCIPLDLEILSRIGCPAQARVNDA